METGKLITHVVERTELFPVMGSNAVLAADELKYFYADHCSFTSHLIARSLQSKGHNVEIKTVRFRIGTAFELPMLEQGRGYKALHIGHLDMRFGAGFAFIAHSVVIMDGEAFDFLAPTMGNANYTGIERWPSTSRHEHSGGTGMYYNYMRAEGQNENSLLQWLVREALQVHTALVGGMSDNVVEQMLAIWELD
jgi:hypothetical protein